MILLDKLYTVTSRDTTDAASVSYQIRLNPEHEIFKAHFPGEPIMPGACIVQVATELASMWQQSELEIAKVINLKFLAVIKPDVVTELAVDLKVKKADENGLQLNVSLVSDETEYTKMTLLFRESRQ